MPIASHEPSLALVQVMSDPVPGAIVACVLAIILASASITKWRDLGEFERSLAAYRLLPESALKAVSKLLPLFESLSAVLLIYAPARSLGLVLAGALMLLFAVAMAINLARGRADIACGCGGPNQTLSWALVTRNLVLSALAGIFAGLTAEGVAGPSETSRSWEWLDYFSVAFSSLALYGLYVIGNQLLAQGARARAT